MSMGFSRQEYWSGLPFPSPEELPNPGIRPWSPASQADSLPFESYREGVPIKPEVHTFTLSLHYPIELFYNFHLKRRNRGLCRAESWM